MINDHKSNKAVCHDLFSNEFFYFLSNSLQRKLTKVIIDYMMPVFDSYRSWYTGQAIVNYMGYV